MTYKNKMPYYVYIMASRKNGTLYVGVTNNVAKRVFNHRNGDGGRFTKQYKVKRLVHVETLDRIDDAIMREKQLKKWNRQWKIDLIEANNPDWADLYEILNQ